MQARIADLEEKVVQADRIIVSAAATSVSVGDMSKKLQSAHALDVICHLEQSTITSSSPEEIVSALRHVLRTCTGAFEPTMGEQSSPRSTCRFSSNNDARPLTSFRGLFREARRVASLRCHGRTLEVGWTRWHVVLQIKLHHTGGIAFVAR